MELRGREGAEGGEGGREGEGGAEMEPHVIRDQFKRDVHANAYRLLQDKWSINTAYTRL